MILTALARTEVIALITLVVAVITAIGAILVIRNAKLKYGLLIFLSIVVICSIAALFGISSDGESANSNKPSGTDPSQNPPLTQNSNAPANKNSLSLNHGTVPVPPRKYVVTIIVPSEMSDAEIFVDEKPADIIERQLLVVTISVDQKDQSSRILLQKGARQCTETLLIRKNVQLIPCG